MTLRWFEISACTANSEGLPPSLAQHGSYRRPSTSTSLPFQDTRACRKRHPRSSALVLRPWRSWNDLGPCVSAFLYLVVSRLFGWLRLSRRPESWKAAEILLLRHQLTVLQRQVDARPKVNWADRAFIALLIDVIPKHRRGGLRLIVTPQTVLRWHREIVRRRWAAKSRHKHPGRPRVHRTITTSVLRLAKENPGWGYRRIHGELAGIGIQVAPSTVWEILTKAGLPPAPRRAGPTWAQFLHSQAQAILATDFFTVDLLDGTSAYVLAVIEHASRRIRILGVTAHPDNAWVTQMGRNLMMDLDGHLHAVKFLLRDRDTKFTAAWDAVFADSDIRILRSPIRAPRATAIMKRWIGSCRRELLDQTLIWNQRHLLTVLREYEAHHNAHRPHRSLGQAAPLKPLPAPVTDLDSLRLRRQNNVSGVINEYTLAS
jgi:putative transposase